jgi:hypothetical protein
MLSREMKNKWQNKCARKEKKAWKNKKKERDEIVYGDAVGNGGRLLSPGLSGVPPSNSPPSGDPQGPLPPVTPGNST